jgi:hypothetical protein
VRSVSGVMSATARILLCLGTAAGLSAAVLASSAAAATARANPHLTEHQVLRIALKGAAAAHDRHPILVEHATGPRNKVELVATGEQGSGTEWSYLIAERGKFELTNVPEPPGAHGGIKGTVLTIVVNARTGQVTDVGLSNRYPNLRKLASPRTDLAVGIP